MKKVPLWKAAIYMLTIVYALFLVFISSITNLEDHTVLWLITLSLILVGFFFWLILYLHHRSENK